MNLKIWLSNVKVFNYTQGWIYLLRSPGANTSSWTPTDPPKQCEYINTDFRE